MNKQLLTVRCPLDLMAKIENQMQQQNTSKTDVVVDMLANYIPSLPITERWRLPQIPAFYLAIAPSNEVLYIGYTDNLCDEWHNHPAWSGLMRYGNAVRIVWFESPAGAFPTVDESILTRLGASGNATKADSPEDLRSLISTAVDEAIAPLHQKIAKLEEEIAAVKK